METRALHTDDNAEIVYRYRPGDRPWVLLHGLGCDSSLWDGVVDGLPADNGLLIPDLRGHGGSTLGFAVPSVDLWARDVLTLIGREGLERPAVVGLSMGGYAALALADARPDLPRAYGLVSTTARADDPSGRRRRADGLATVQREGWEAFAREMLPSLLCPGHPGHASNRERLLEMFARAGSAGLTSALLALAHRKDRRSVLAGLGAPVTVVVGDSDVLTPLERAREMAEAAPRGALHVLPGVAHMSALEAPADVARALQGGQV